MITTICLWWVGIKMGAPIWYYILLSIGLIVRFIDAVKTVKERKKKQHL